MAEDNAVTTPKTCRDCGQIVDVDLLTQGGDPMTTDDAAGLDWSDFCPSPNCPVKSDR